MFGPDWNPGESQTVRCEPPVDDQWEKIPTTLVSMAPDKLLIEKDIDVLVGVFHIMWEDMPRRRTYKIRLCDAVSFDGTYVGCSLKVGFSQTVEVKF